MSAALAITFIVCAVVFLSLGALFAATDAALTVRSRADLFKLAAGNSRTDNAIRAIANDESAHQTTLSFARVATESLAAVLITVVVVKNIENLWLALAASALLIFVSSFLLAGASPRHFGIVKPDWVLRRTALLARGVRLVLGPFAIGLLRLNSAVGSRSTAQVAEEDADKALLSLVDRAAERDVLEEEDRDYIHSLLRFGDTRVREIMVPRTDMLTVDADSSMQNALEEILASRRSRMPVIADDNDDVLGVIHLRDAAGFNLRHSDEAATAPVTRMMKSALFVPDLMRAADLLQQMQRENVHLALTVDEYGGISGLVTLEDLIEELVGDIYDEHDKEVAEIQELDGGGYLLNPRLQVSELGELFDIELTDADVDTVGGLFVKELGRLAEAGDTVAFAGIELVAVRVDRRGTIQELNARWIGEHAQHESAERISEEESE